MTDWLDGYLARKWHQVTELGAFLDPWADKLLVDGVLIACGLLNTEILPFVMIFILRDLVVEVMRRAVRQVGQTVSVSYIGKTKTALQMTGLFLLLGLRALRCFPGTGLICQLFGGIGTIAMIAALLVSVISGIDYVVKGYRILRG